MKNIHRKPRFLREITLIEVCLWFGLIGVGAFGAWFTFGPIWLSYLGR